MCGCNDLWLVYFSITNYSDVFTFLRRLCKSLFTFLGATEQLVVCLTCSVCKRRPAVRLWTDVFSMVSMRNAQWLWNCSVVCIVRGVTLPEAHGVRGSNVNFVLQCLMKKVGPRQREKKKTISQVIAVRCFIIGSTCMGIRKKQT